MFQARQLSSIEKVKIEVMKILTYSGVEVDEQCAAGILHLREKDLIILRDKTLFLDKDAFICVSGLETWDFYNYIRMITGLDCLVSEAKLRPKYVYYFLHFPELGKCFPLKTVLDFQAILNSVLINDIESDVRVLFSNLGLNRDILAALAPDEIREHSWELKLESYYRVFDHQQSLSDFYFKNRIETTTVYL